MRSRRVIAISGLFALLLALPALGQGNPTGKLSGRVTDATDGTPMPGVTVTVSSPNLQGEKQTTTSANGDYLFPALPPGPYTVVFALEGMSDVRRELTINAAQSVPLDAQMSLAAIEEEIVVTGVQEELSTVSKSSQVSTTVGKALVDEVAGGRTLTQIVALTPGVQPNGPTKSDTTGLGNITVSGAPTYENLFLINGVVLNENVRGQAFDLFIEDAIQETTVASAGMSAEYGRFSGGVVNVLTKSGGNDFSGSARATLNNQTWEEERTNPATGGKAPQTDKTVPTYELTLGGPILRDRLWFFVAGRDVENERQLTTGAPTVISYQNVRDQQRYEGKLTATLTPRHSLLANYQEIEDAEIGNSFGTILDTASLVNRETPQELMSLNYTGVLSDNLFLTAQYSEREFTFIGSGAQTTDLIAGTLLLDRSRSSARYHAPTFCGICRPEERDNTNALLKASYFLSTGSLGTHDLVVGYDTFEDIRAADNHQSGSDWRILGTGADISGTDITPRFLGDGSTIIQFDPILVETRGTSFKTNSLFVNDSWRVNDRLSFNVGVRYDENDGENASGQKVAEDSHISPRLAATYDLRGNGDWVFFGSYGQYVTALANSIADSSSAGGVPSTFQWIYRGPDITGVSQDEALRQLFDWFAATNGGLPTVAQPLGGGGVPVSAAAIRGLSQQIRGSLDSPNVTEYSFGASRSIGARGVVRADLVFREWGNFYHQRTDTSTGTVSGQIGDIVQTFDLTLVENNENLYEREYRGLHTQFRYRATDRLDFGGNWTLSETEGNYNAETQVNGPVAGGLGNYPEYFDVSWNSPSGPLTIDQRHRVNLYGVYRILDGDRHSLSASLLQNYGSGRPYEAAGTIVIRPYVTNPGYRTPPARVGYFFSDRGAFETEDVTSTNVAFNYELHLGPAEIFVKPEVVNVFNEDAVDTTDVRFFNTSVLTADNAAACSGSATGRCLPFNPFTETPVENVHWVKGSNFGKPINPLAFQQPRTYRLAVGVRF